MSILDKIKSTKTRRTPRILSVKSAINLTPNMRRVTLQGEDLTSFPKNSEGAYIKLILSHPDNGTSVMRTYTVSEQRPAENEIDVDFMLHSDNDSAAHGIASHWSIHAQVGDKISIAGPGPAKFININADYFLLAADMTALPALTVNLKTLPKNAQGTVFIEVLSETDKQTLQKPENIKIIWVINDAPGSDATPLFHAVEQADLPAGQVAVWAACEFKTMKKIRRYLKIERGIEKSHLYVSSYWKKGITEEEHKLVKQRDSKKS